MNYAQLALFDNVFRNLIALNEEVRRQNPGLVTKDSPVEAFRDYASICFDPGQRTGKSFWISHAASQRDAIVTFEAQFSNYTGCGAKLYHMPYINSCSGKFLNFRYVFVEQARLVSESAMAKVYQLFGDTDTIFVLI